MKGLIWLRRLVVVLLAAALLILLLGVYIIVDNMVRVAMVGGFGGGFLPICLWLDRKLTWKLQRKLLLPSMITRLEASGEPTPKGRRAA